jgi:hypothetical protein
MVDPGHVFRRALSWLPAHFVSQTDTPIGAPRQFSSTEHLSIEAVAAYSDGELPMKAYLRAAHHLSVCPQCAAEVQGQGEASAALRDCQQVNMPSTLMGLLSQIPQSTPPPQPPQFTDEITRGRRKRR